VGLILGLGRKGGSQWGKPLRQRVGASAGEKSEKSVDIERLGGRLDGAK